MSGLDEKGLLPCPFCGWKARAAGSMSHTHIYCDNCRAHGPSVFHGGPTNDRTTLNRCEEEAIAAWNRRALTDTPIPDDVIAISFPIAVSLAGNVTNNLDASLVQLAAEHQIARAILAERTAQAERIRELEDALRGINGLVAAPRSSSDNDRLYAALDALDKARALARSALRGNNG